MPRKPEFEGFIVGPSLSEEMRAVTEMLALPAPERLAAVEQWSDTARDEAVAFSKREVANLVGEK